jgi:hypothetical protein
VPHVQARLIAHSVWTKLTRLYESKDEMTKMYLRDKFTNFQNKGKWEHHKTFKSLLEKLFTTRSLVLYKDV